MALFLGAVEEEVTRRDLNEVSLLPQKEKCLQHLSSFSLSFPLSFSLPSIPSITSLSLFPERPVSYSLSLSLFPSLSLSLSLFSLPSITSLHSCSLSLSPLLYQTPSNH